jgi:hypothetical protein
MVRLFFTFSWFKIEKSHFSNISITLVMQKQEVAPSTPTKHDENQEVAPSTPTKHDERADGHVVTPKKAKLDFDFWGKNTKNEGSSTIATTELKSQNLVDLHAGTMYVKLKS